MATSPITHIPLGDLIGVKFDQVDTSQQFKLGTTCRSDQGGEFIYVKASEAIVGAGYVCQIDDDLAIVHVDTTASAGKRGMAVGVAQDAIASGSYGWLQRKGIGDVYISASCAANTELNVTGSNGILDDDATSGSEVVKGIVMENTQGGSAGLNVAHINYPEVERTL